MLKLHKRCQVQLQNISAQTYNFPIHRLWIHHSQHNSVMFSWYHFDEEEKKSCLETDWNCTTLINVLVQLQLWPV